jgi:hypothetical protein
MPRTGDPRYTATAHALAHADHGPQGHLYHDARGNHGEVQYTRRGVGVLSSARARETTMSKITSCPVHRTVQASTSRQHPIRPDNTDRLQRPCGAYTGPSATKTVGPALARKPVSCLRSLLRRAASAVTSRHYCESLKHCDPSWVRNGRTRRTDLSSCASELVPCGLGFNIYFGLLR